MTASKTSALMVTATLSARIVDEPSAMAASASLGGDFDID